MSSSSATAEQTTEGTGIGSLPREIWILVIGSFIVAVGMGIVAPALPTFATSFDVGVTAASFVISAFALMRLAFAPVSGRLVSFFGERSIYVWGITIVGLSTAACAFAGSYWQLLVFRALGGTGSTMFTVSAVALLVRLAPPHLRGQASGVWATSFLLGNVSGPIIGGLMVGYSLRLPFVTYGAALFIAAFIGWLMLRKSTLAAPRTDTGETQSLTVREALRNRTYRAAMLSNFSNGWAVFGVRIALVPLFVVEILRSTQAMAGVALSVFAVGNAAVLLVSGRIADRRGRKPLVLIGLAVSGAATASLGFTDSVPWFLVASLIAGMGAGILNPAQNAAVADIIGAKGKGGPVLAAFQMSADLGAILGPLIAGVLADVISYQAAFAVTGLTAVLGLVAWAGAPETRPTRAS
ncbi:Predicted arabinose efflux permease, MFS family [Saccharopolyspora antimicrobica]|uniref:MFS family arabinose efflux permease n=1 Tax=Saccharopolyspora antimicrobica TaxID=455193 RepID=A0A1I5AAK8_9PSEU|nr:MFS transporter [Saccharopolyspora antimicrobica]RKT83206.1 putative MFS family arabinose efflux permease [Saccharopolyspora antimicrobica]SFN59631.1 Predicted arabinose efflux permease, MFS family [Saccharopolyspora antimicrobica]